MNKFNFYRYQYPKNSIKLLLVMSVVLVVGCGHYHDDFYHGGNYHPGYYPYYSNSHHYHSYSPRYNSYHSPKYKYDYSVRENVNQNINNSINIGGPRYYEATSRQTRSFYVDDTRSAILKLEDGTLQQVNVVEQQKYIVPACQTAIQAVNARHYSSFQYATCQ